MATGGGRSGRGPAAVLALLVAGHAAAFAALFPVAGMAGGEAIAEGDFPLHWYLAHAVLPALREGRSWGYDPSMLCGWPVGLVSSASNKAFELGALLLSPLLSPGRAVNLLVAAMYLAVPLLAWASARSERGWTGVLAVVLALSVWHTDSTLRWAWLGGMSSWAFAVTAAPSLALAAVGLARRPGLLGGLAVAGLGVAVVAAHLLGAVLVAPAAAVALAAALSGPWRGRRLAALALASAPALAFLSWWGKDLARHGQRRVTSPSYLTGGTDLFARDVLLRARRDEAGRPRHEMVGNPLRKSTAARNLLYVLGGAGLVAWWQAGRRHEALAVGAGAAASWALAYPGPDLLAAVRGLEPYRFSVATPLFLVAPAASWLSRALAGGRRGAGPATTAVLALAGLASAGLVIEAAGRVRRDLVERPALAASGEALGFREILVALARLPRGSRVLIDNALVGPIAAVRLGLDVASGPGDHVFEPHGEAIAAHGFFEGVRGRFPDAAAGARFLTRYGVSFVLTTYDEMRAVWGEGGLGLGVREVIRVRHPGGGPRVAAILYEVREPAPLVEPGSVRTVAGGLEVEGPPGGWVALRWHVAAGLGTVPPAELGSWRDDPDQQVPFLRVRVPAGGRVRIVAGG